MASEERQDIYYQTNPAVSARLRGDKGAVLFDADTGREKVVNATGAFTWARLDGSRSAADIAAELQRAFDGAAFREVAEDVACFLEEMNALGFAVAGATRPQARTAPAGFIEVSDAPLGLDLSLTGKCNLHCVYCFYQEQMKTRPDLPRDEWLAFFKELGRLAVRDVCLSGGEVFVRPDLWDLIDDVIDNRMRYRINTNGTLLTENLLARFETGQRRRRLSGIQVSIDGSCSEVHDKSRGPGSFEKAIRGLRLLKEAMLPATVRVTVNRHNVDDLDHIARLLLDEIGINSFSTNDAMPMGAGCENQKDILLTAAQQVTAMKALARLADQYAGRITALAGPLANWRMYRQMEKARAAGKTANQGYMGYLTACGCVFNQLAVHHDGMITPCNILGELVMGRVNRDSLAEIWGNHPLLKKLRDRRQIPMSDVPGCEDCRWAAFCNGGCPGLAYELTGDVNRANPHDCYRRFLGEGVKVLEC